MLGTYYPFTLPTTCTGKVLFDGRDWVSELPPPKAATIQDVWISLGPTATSAGWVGPGAVGFKPYAGQPLSCGPPTPTKKSVTPKLLVNHTPPIPSYCSITTVTTTGTITRAINVAYDQCIADHSPSEAEIWTTTGTEMTPAQVVAQVMSRDGPPGSVPTAVYVYKTTYAGAGKLFETGDRPTVTPKAPAYLVTTHWSTGRVATSVIDAISGTGTTGCSGCDIVQPDGKVIKTPANH